MTHNQVSSLQEQLNCQDKEISELMDRYEIETAKRDELQKQFFELQQWVENAECDLIRTSGEQKNIIECQLKKLEKSEQSLLQLRSDKHKLNDANKCLEKQLKTLETNEQKLNDEIKKLETSETNLKNELDNVTNQLCEKTCVVDKLTKQLECVKRKLLDVQKQLEECKTEVSQLNDKCKSLETELASTKTKLEECQTTECRLREQCRDLEADLECTRTKLEDAKTRAAATEVRLKAEADALAKELECRVRKLREAETECDEWKRRAAEEQCKVNRLDALVAELRAAGERERGEAEAREQKLKRDVNERDEKVCRLDEQLAAARRDNETLACELAALKTRVRATEVKLENAQRSAESKDRAHEETRERLEREKSVLSGELQLKTAAVTELERQVCQLRDEISRSRSSGPPPRACTDGRDNRVMTANDSFVKRLKRLYCDLDMAKRGKKN